MKTPMNKRSHLLAALALAPLLGAVPATVQAEGLGAVDGVRYTRSNPVGMAASANGEPQAGTTSRACPTGWKAAAAGAVVADSRGRQGLSTVSATYNEGAYAAAWNAGPVSSTLASYAVCVPGATVVHHLAQSGPNFTGPGSVGDVVVCDPGTHVASGGAWAIGPGVDPKVSLNSLAPVDLPTDEDLVRDDGWMTSAYYSGDGGHKVMFEATCIEGPRPAYRSATVSLPAKSARIVRVSCPLAREVVGGGVYMSGPSKDADVLTTRPYDSKDANTVPEDGWLARVRNRSSQELTMTGHAVCR